MDIYKYAMQIELDGKHFYHDLVRKINNTGITKNVFSIGEYEKIDQ